MTMDPKEELDAGQLRVALDFARNTHKTLAEALDRSEADVVRLRSVLHGLREFWSDIEARSSDAHDVYQKEAHRRGDVRHADAYADLSEATKEWDRVLVRWVLSTIEAAAKVLK